MKRKGILIGAVVALSLILSSCGLASSGINELCLVYSGGTFEEKNYVKLLDPGSTNTGIGIGSSKYCYRIDQRSYIADARFDAANSETPGDTRPVEVVSADDTRMSVEYQLYFKINQDEEVLRQFHENLGVKTEAYKDEGWVQMLREYFEPQIERALETAALQHGWRDLYASDEARQAFQQETVSILKRNINDVIGGDYFCGPQYEGKDDECGDFTFTVGKPFPTNQDIVKAVEGEQKAKADTVAQEQRNEQIRKQLEAENELVALYGPYGALIQQAIKSGKIQFMVLPDGSSVAVPPPGE